MRIDQSKTCLGDRSGARATLLCCTLLAAFAVVTLPGSAADPSHHSLVCGRTRFSLTNTYDSATFIKSQTLDAHRASHPPFRVDLRNRRHGADAGLFGSVSSWICNRSGHRIFLELLYACNTYMNPADVDRYCGGDKMVEWERYIGADGQPLDRGYYIDDPRYHELDRRLGLTENRADDMLRADRRHQPGRERHHRSPGINSLGRNSIPLRQGGDKERRAAHIR